MPVKDYSTTPASNTTISSINIAEGCAPGGINNAIRRLMADIATESAATTSIASASTVDLGAQNGSVTITGTTTITAFGTATAGLVRRVNFTGALILTYNATSLILPGSNNITTIAGDTAEFESLGSGNWRCNRYTRSTGQSIVVPLPLGYLSGLTLTNNVTDASNDIDFSSGVCRDSTNAFNISCSALTKQLDAAWVAGTNAGGLDTGSKANSTWYHCYTIAKADGTADFLYSTSATSPTMPSGYTYFRRIGSVRTDSGGAILAFRQDADHFILATYVTDVNAASTTSATTNTITCPSGVRTRAIVSVSQVTPSPGTTFSLITSTTNTDETPSASLFNIGGINSTIQTQHAVTLEIWTNSNSQIRRRSNNTTSTIIILTRGWMDPRGQ